jgi:hypothetical protein
MYVCMYVCMYVQEQSKIDLKTHIPLYFDQYKQIMYVLISILWQ